jgi:hypothetical protein
MRTFVMIVCAGLLGLVIGIGQSTAEFWGARENFVTRTNLEEQLKNDPSEKGTPRAVVVGSPDFDFGVGERNTPQFHEFEIRNDGAAPLKIEVEHTTCKCTVAELETGSLQPGQSTKVRLEWEAKGYQDEFQQSAELHTSDPAHPVIRLTIRGRIIQTVRPEPEELQLPSLSANEDATATVKLFGFIEEPIQILEHSFDNPDKLEHYKLDIAPLSAEEIAAVPDAKQGFLLTLHVKSGLPVGPLSQTIRLKTNVPTASTIEIPVQLVVSSDIYIIKARGGRGFHEEKNLLTLGKLKSSQGERVKMFIFVKGPHRETTEIEIDSVEPAGVLEATLGEAEKLGNGNVIRFPLDIEVPPGQSPINLQGGEQGKLGRVVFRTTHPDAKEVRLFVQFAIE